MGFNLEELKKSNKENEELVTGRLQAFIDKFEEEIGSEEFEDWLQEELSKNSGRGRMHFGIGTSGQEAGKIGACNKFIIFGDYSFEPIISLAIPEYAIMGKSSYGNEYPEHVKEYNDYIDAMNTCYKNLVIRLKKLGLKVVSNHPNFTIDFRETTFKVLIEIDDEYWFSRIVEYYFSNETFYFRVTNNSVSHSYDTQEKADIE